MRSDRKEASISVVCDKAKELIDLANSEFSDLTLAELKLLQAVAKSEVAWCGPSKDPENGGG
jgi:hypothetical protein